MDPKPQFLMVGLPESGKSTFLAAMWEVVRSDKVPGAMKLGTLVGDYSYVNKLHELWLEGIPLKRTKVEREGLVAIPLRDDALGDSTIVTPDLSGESFDVQWEMRTISKKYYEYLLVVKGLLAFVHSEKFNTGPLIGRQTRELEELIRADSEQPQETKPGNREESSSNGIKDHSPEPKPVPFDPEKVPTQTKVVDMLSQALRVSSHGKGVTRVGLVVSAWDLVKQKFNTPDQWLRVNMPLLGQFLASNTKRFDYKLFGVSAQGTELNEKNRDEYLQNRRDLLKLHSASDRIIVTDGESVGHNITAPLQWLRQL